MLKEPSDAACKTRFKMWWRLIGSAVEHAAELCDKVVDFQKLFLDSEEDDEESGSLAEALSAMSEEWKPASHIQGTRCRRPDQR